MVIKPGPPLEEIELVTLTKAGTVATEVAVHREAEAMTGRKWLNMPVQSSLSVRRNLPSPIRQVARTARNDN